MKGGGTKLETMDDPRGYDPELEKLVGNSKVAKPWSDKDKDVMTRYYGKILTKDLAMRLGREPRNVVRMASHMGLVYFKNKEE
jgi:hypothetical protein